MLEQAAAAFARPCGCQAAARPRSQRRADIATGVVASWISHIALLGQHACAHAVPAREKASMISELLRRESLAVQQSRELSLTPSLMKQEWVCLIVLENRCRAAQLVDAEQAQAKSLKRCRLCKVIDHQWPAPQLSTCQRDAVPK